MKLFYFFTIALIMGLHNGMAQPWQTVIGPVIRHQVRTMMGAMGAAGQHGIEKFLNNVGHTNNRTAPGAQ
ncbi:hypothetical protein GCK32_012518 [Trichostrongylus colubriformis]|uniref:Uncharacterized protein n=1 Tax=Trichostrongylus colubriformis TaxID=6319 RepID=A0AAN8FGC4_TRICO